MATVYLCARRCFSNRRALGCIWLDCGRQMVLSSRRRGWRFAYEVDLEDSRRTALALRNPLVNGPLSRDFNSRVQSTSIPSQLHNNMCTFFFALIYLTSSDDRYVSRELSQRFLRCLGFNIPRESMLTTQEHDVPLLVLRMSKQYLKLLLSSLLSWFWFDYDIKYDTENLC